MYIAIVLWCWLDNRMSWETPDPYGTSQYPFPSFMVILVKSTCSYTPCLFFFFGVCACMVWNTVSVLYSYLGLAEAELTHYLAGTHTSCHLGNIKAWHLRMKFGQKRMWWQLGFERTLKEWRCMWRGRQCQTQLRANYNESNSGWGPHAEEV